jgi:hypothetical protein
MNSPPYYLQPTAYHLSLKTHPKPLLGGEFKSLQLSAYYLQPTAFLLFLSLNFGISFTLFNFNSIKDSKVRQKQSINVYYSAL